MKCYVDITTDDNANDYREFAVGTDVKETVEYLKQCMVKNEPIVLEDDYGIVNIINCNKILNIKVKRIGGK